MEMTDKFVPWTIDFETTADGYEGSPKACYKANYVLATSYGLSLDTIANSLHSDSLLIGHNLQFDLGYLMRDVPNHPWHKGNYWCTAVAEYILSGHTVLYPGLEETCARHGIEYNKSFDVAAWIASGKKLQDADMEVLTLYATEDANATYKLAQSQWKQAYLLGGEKLIQLILDQSNNIPAICSIELNGMEFDVDKAGGQLLDNDALAKASREKIKALIAVQYPKFRLEDIDRLNVTANRTVSAVLFGEPKEIVVGKKKKEMAVLKFDTPIAIPLKGAAINPNLGYSVADEVLKQYKSSFCSEILDYRKIVKESSTYLSPLISRALFNSDRIIHTNIHTTSTNTGRTSSSSPNFQNLPDEIRKLFHSKHKIKEIDFKQLEVCAIAELSGDIVLIQDIIDGVDIHYETGKSVFGWVSTKDMNPEDRRTVKSIVFGLCYGGGPTTLAAQSGAPIELVRGIIESFYSRYPQVKEWHDDTIQQAEYFSRPIKEVHPDGTVIRETKIDIPNTKRFFRFKTEATPEWLRARKPWSFMPTKLKNYRAQGFAGGDIVLNFLKVLFYLIGGHTSDIKLRNMIHDSVVATVPEHLEATFDVCVEQAKEYITQYLNLRVPLTVEVKSSGNRWK